MGVSKVAAVAVALLLVSAPAACRDGGSPVAARQAALDRAHATEVVERAERIERQTMADLRAARLASAFGGRALRVLKAQVGVMASRGLRIEETAVVVALVAWDPNAAEAVLQVESRRALLTPETPDPAWSASVRQWWSKLRYQAGSWWVVDQQDLSPDRWRPAT